MVPFRNTECLYRPLMILFDAVGYCLRQGTRAVEIGDLRTAISRRGHSVMISDCLQMHTHDGEDAAESC